jgi:hypothetical protein
MLLTLGINSPLVELLMSSIALGAGADPSLLIPTLCENTKQFKIDEKAKTSIEYFMTDFFKNE